MLNILIYVAIILCGALLVRAKLLPESILKRLSVLQSIALYLLLGAMGLKIGMDMELMAKLHLLGWKAFVVSCFAMAASVVVIRVVYGGGQK